MDRNIHNSEREWSFMQRSRQPGWPGRSGSKSATEPAAGSATESEYYRGMRLRGRRAPGGGPLLRPTHPARSPESGRRPMAAEPATKAQLAGIGRSIVELSRTSLPEWPRRMHVWSGQVIALADRGQQGRCRRNINQAGAQPDPDARPRRHDPVLGDYPGPIGALERDDDLAPGVEF